MSMMIVSRLVGRWGTVFGLLVAALFLAGCKSGTENSGFTQLQGYGGGVSAQVGAVSNDLPPKHIGGDTMDSIRSGDTLRVNFSDLPIVVQSPMEERVRDDG